MVLFFSFFLLLTVSQSLFFVIHLALPHYSPLFFTSHHFNQTQSAISVRVLHSKAEPLNSTQVIPLSRMLHPVHLMDITIYLSLQSDRNEDEFLPLPLIYGEMTVDWQTGITQPEIND